MALTLGLSSSGEPLRIDLALNGEVRENGELLGRMDGACILDLHGKVVSLVDDHGSVSGSQGEHLGTLQQPTKPLETDDKPVKVDEAFVSNDGDMTAVALDGALWAVRAHERKGFSLPEGVESGYQSKASRTVLVLFEALGDLGP